MLEWVDWFNHRRLLEPIGNVPPAELEAMYYTQKVGLTRGLDLTGKVSGILGAVHSPQTRRLPWAPGGPKVARLGSTC